MDASVISQSTGSIDASRESRGKELLRTATRLSSSFNDELDKAVKTDEHHKSDYDKVKSKREKKLMDACVESESLFVNQMLKQMRSTVQKGEMLHGGQTEEIFEDMLYDQYALSISKTANLGIAKMMYQQLSKAI
ncbi:MAG TPA: rod-binding protein [Spirochaetota bacterium]